MKHAKQDQSDIHAHKQHVLEYLNVDGLAKWQVLGRIEDENVKRRSLILLKHHDYSLSELQGKTLQHLQHPVPVHFHLLKQNLCFLCATSFTGKIDSTWGVYAHADCIKANVVDIGKLGHLLPLDQIASLIPHVQSHIHYRKVFKVFSTSLGHLPEESTLAWYRKAHAQQITDHRTMVVEAEAAAKAAVAQEKKRVRDEKTAEARRWKKEFHTLARTYEWYTFRSWAACSEATSYHWKRKFDPPLPVERAVEQAGKFWRHKSHIPERLWGYAFSSSTVTEEELTEWATVDMPLEEMVQQILVQKADTAVNTTWNRPVQKTLVSALKYLIEKYKVVGLGLRLERDQLFKTYVCSDKSLQDVLEMVEGLHMIRPERNFDSWTLLTLEKVSKAARASVCWPSRLWSAARIKSIPHYMTEVAEIGRYLAGNEA